MAEDNGQETLSYKVSIDIADVKTAKEELANLKKDINNPAKAKVDVSSIQDGIAVYKKFGDTAKQVSNAIKNIGNNNIGRLTSDMQNLSKAAEQVKMNYQGIEKLLHGMDKGGFDKIAQEVDGWIENYRRNGGEKNIKTIQEVMSNWSKSTGATRGSKEWQAFQTDYIKKAAAEVYKLGGSIETIQRLASKPLGAKSIDSSTSSMKALGTATEKVAATFENLKKAISGLDTKGVNALAKEMNQHFVAQGDDSFAEMIKNKNMTKDDRVDYLAFEAENMYKEGVQLRALPQFNDPTQPQVQPKSKGQPKEQMQEPTQPQTKWTAKNMENLKQYWTNRMVASQHAEMKNQMLSEEELRNIFNYTMKEVRLADGTEHRGGSHETERSKEIKEVQQSHKNEIKEAEDAQKTIERYNKEAAKQLEALKQKEQQARQFANKIQQWQSEYNKVKQKSSKKNKGKAPKELSEEERRKLLSQASGHRIGDRNYASTIRHLEDKYSNQIDGLVGRDKYDAASESERIQTLANLAKAEKNMQTEANKAKAEKQRQRRAEAKAEKEAAEKQAEAEKKAAEEKIVTQQTVAHASTESANEQVKAQKKVTDAIEQTAKTTGKSKGTEKLSENMQKVNQQVTQSKANFKDLDKTIRNMSSKEIDKLSEKVNKFWDDNRKEGSARHLSVDERARYLSDFDPPKGSDMWYDNKRKVLLDDVKKIAEMKGGLEALGLSTKENAEEEVKTTEETAKKKTRTRKKAAEDAKESAKDEANAEKSAAQEGEEAAKKSAKGKSRAKKKSAEEGAKAAQDEADVEKKAAKDSEEASKKSSEAKSRRRRKAAEDNAKSDDEETRAIKKRQSAMDKLHAQALRDDKHIASLKKKYEDLGRTRQLNLESAPHNGTATGWATYEKRRLQEEDIRKELASYGIDRPARYTPYDEYRKAFDANSSRVQEAARKEEEAGWKRIANGVKKVIEQKKKLATEDAKATKEAQKRLAEYEKLQDKYAQSIESGRGMRRNAFQNMQRKAGELERFFRESEVPFRPHKMTANYDEYMKAVMAVRELKIAEADVEKIIGQQNRLISRGKQLTTEQYQTVKAMGEEAQRRAKAAGSTKDMQMPFSSEQYSTIEKYNREMIAKTAMSWQNQGVDSYSASINRLKHAQEALFAVYQRDPHPKYLQMLGKTRAELSRVTNEFKKYQKQINDTGTTMDGFMMRARSHLEWISSGLALSAMFVLPTQFMNSLENLEARMASIKQVIPMIEGLEDSAKYGTKVEQLERARKEQEELISTAAKYGANLDEVMEAARSIGRMYGQGENGVTNTNIMTAQATRMAVADAFDLLDATRGLESAMSQWNLQTEDSQELLVNTNRILDVWTKTAHRGAASAQDIADAIQLAGTAAYQAGVSFEFFNALVATGVRATARSGNEIGTSIKSMMVSMQTPKAEKALKEWGISLKEIGTDGQMHMRNLEDVILDVAMAVQSTEKDTKDLFLALSGGKFQYSKVSAMLKNGTELMRMLDEIHQVDGDGKTVGFTGQQIEVQLDTLSRKMQTLKDDMQGMVFNIGGIEVMKDFADALDNLIVGISTLSKALNGNLLSMAATFVKWSLYLRIVWKLKDMIMIAVESFKILSQSQVAATVTTNVHTNALRARWAAYMKDIQAEAAGRMSRLGYIAAEKQATASTTQNTTATGANTTAHVRNTEALYAEITAWMRYGTVQKGSALQTAMSSAATVGAMGKLAQGVGLVGGAVAALGGPVTIAITALTVLIPLIWQWAEAVGEAETKMRKTVETHQEHLATMEQDVQKVAQAADYMKRLAKQYDQISDSLANCTEGTKEYTVKQEQLERIKKSLLSAIEDETKLLDENGHINVQTIKDWEKAMLEKKKTALDTADEEIKSSMESTKQNIKDTKARIESLKHEMEILKQSGETWDWLSQVRNSSWRKLGETMDWLGKAFGDKGLQQLGQTTIERANAERVGQNGSGDIEVVERTLKEQEELLKKLEKEEVEYTGMNFTIQQINESIEKGDNVANNPEERGTVDEDEDGGKGSKGSKGSGGGGKSRLPYESDELAAAIHEAAQTEYAKSNSMTEPLLRGLADVQSGMSQDFNDGVRIGAFGVTEEMGKRFGQDVYTPIGNAMTAVLALTQKISDVGGDMGAALNQFTGGRASEVYTASRAQQDAYNYDGADYISSSDFGNDVIAAARQRLGLPYGGSDLSDEFQTVCTTFIQRALVDAGADESIVRALTADANNWAVNAGAAFHPYGDGYAPKPGDIALTGIDESGHSGHANLVDENGTGYYSAGGSAGVSAHYDTPIETAYEGDIEGYIDIAALTGKTRGLGLRSKGSNARKSVFDFRRSSYERLMYQIQKAKEDYEDEAKDIELERAMTGDSYELAAREQLNEQAKLTVEQNSLKLMEAMYKGVQKSIENTIKNAPDLQVALGQEGAKWADLVPEEKKQLASLYKNDNGVFAELVNEEIKLHDALREQAKVVKEQTLKANKYLHMSIEEAAKFENNRLQMKYENFEAGLPDDNDSFYLNHVKSVRAKKEMLEGQIANSTNVRDWAYNQYSQSFEKDQAELAKIQAEIQAGKEHLAILQQEAEGGRDVASAIQAQEQELTNLITSYDILARIGSPETQRLEETFLKADTAVKQLQKDLDKVAKQDLQNVRNYGAQMFTDLIVEGKSFEDVWQSLWKDLARYTINAIFQANNSGNIWGSIFSWFGGGKANGGGLAKGGRIPGYAQGGGMVKGAGSGTSDSILAYIANKDRFVYLSNGEYVMTAEATKRIGQENLDALNGYAEGGAINPTPYIPTLSNRASKRAGSLSNKNPNARMEQLMQEQTNVIQSMSNGGNGQIVVLNTKASSADVLKAMQENPRQVQALLGQQRRAGFK